MRIVSVIETTATIETCKGVTISFGPIDDDRWDIYESNTGEYVGVLGVDEVGMFVEAAINEAYQRKGIATAVIRYLVEQFERSFYFWTPDGHSHEDSRYLSTQGAALANSLVNAGLAKWIGSDESYSGDEYN